MQLKITLVWIAMFSAFSIPCQTARSQEPMQQPHPIQYRLSFRQAATHRVEVEVSIPAEGAGEIRLMMPVWTPGSYMVREYARHVETIAARDGASNQPLPIRKLDKNHWQVDCPGVQEVVVDYVVYGREMGVRTNWVENEFAFLTGAATFLTRDDFLDRPHVVRFDSLPQWTDIATSLKRLDAREPWTRRASNYHELVDSPIVMGCIDIQTETIGGATHHLASLGTDSMWDTSRAMKDVAKLVHT